MEDGRWKMEDGRWKKAGESLIACVHTCHIIGFQLVKYDVVVREWADRLKIWMILCDVRRYANSGIAHGQPSATWRSGSAGLTTLDSSDTEALDRNSGT